MINGLVGKYQLAEEPFWPVNASRFVRYVTNLAHRSTISLKQW